MLSGGIMSPKIIYSPYSAWSFSTPSIKVWVETSYRHPTFYPDIRESVFFFQFVFDNKDVNSRTLDEKGTVHILGGIKCVTLSEAVAASYAVPRDLKKKTNPVINSIPLVHYRKSAKCGLNKIKIVSIRVNTADRELVKHGLKLDTVWVAGFLFSENHLLFWNGYMQEAMQKVGIPFINLNPSNMTTINSALSFAASKCHARKKPCIITFDQPLFIKTCDIVAAAEQGSPISSIIVILGGFHLLMCFFGFCRAHYAGNVYCLIHKFPYLKDEQALMRSMKSIGGLTHGRGITEETLLRPLVAYE
ncbi:hypothetical protein PR048_022913, partial [Dryococelus australis]